MKKFHDNSNYASAPAIRKYMESRNLTAATKLWVVVKYDIKALVTRSDLCKWTGAFNTSTMNIWAEKEGLPVLLTSDFQEVKSFLADKSEEYYLDGGEVVHDVEGEVYNIANARKRGYGAFCFDSKIEGNAIMIDSCGFWHAPTTIEFWDNEKGLVVKHD